MTVQTIVVFDKQKKNRLNKILIFLFTKRNSIYRTVVIWRDCHQLATHSIHS
jgi:hypothetical protein